MNVLSCFDGMSCGQLALNRAKIKIDTYYASEIEQHSIIVTQNNFPNTIQLGDIKFISALKLNKIDLIIGGSPCQDISGLNKEQKGLNGKNSSLFFDFVRLKDEVFSINKNAFFLLENVDGKKEAINEISRTLGVRPIRLDSKLVSAQKRKRLFWTNIPVNSIPTPKYIYLKDILQEKVDEKYFLKDGRLKWLIGDSGNKSIKKRFTGIDLQKAGCLTKRGEKSWNCNYVTDNGRIRKLTPIEWERLQTVPDDYTIFAPEDKRYEMLGNGWTVDIIAHIFKHIPKQTK